MFENITIKKFIEDLASSAPAPGGGSAAALSASLAAALSSMVFNLTVGKKAYNNLNDDDKNKVDNSLKVANEIKDEFIQLMEKDASTFLELMSCFKLPKESDSEKEYRHKKLNEGYINSLNVPFELAKKTVALYEHILISAKYGNVNVISDAGVAAILLQAALESAVLNVKINLACVDDEELKKNKMKECKRFVEEGHRLKEEIMCLVNSKIKI